MKSVLSIFAMATAFVLFSAFTMWNPATQEFVGSSSCKGCHNTAKTGKQYKHWLGTAHANAFKTLQSEKADKIAAGKGLSTKAAETAECLGCHVTGMNVDGAKFGKKFKKEDGIGCESCHGAGKGYKTKHNKKEKMKDALAAGLQLPKVADGSAEKLCVTCHNEKSPTFKSFAFKKQWKKIAHPLPKK